MRERRVFVSFLGAGNYWPVPYRWGEQDYSSEYVQEAELHMMGAFDRVFILGTKTSEEKHWVPQLRERLSSFGAEFFQIPEELTVEASWKAFEQLLALVERGDELWFDMTHGFRSIPIVFSTALRFLQVAMGVRLGGVLYGVGFKGAQNFGEISDLSEFYKIDEWAEGVSRLVEQADPEMLVHLSKGGGPFRIELFQDPSFARSLQALTDAVRNVEVNRVEAHARPVLAQISEALSAVDSGAERVLLKMVAEKFQGLIAAEPLSGRYDRDYFVVQLRLVELLIEHGLLMQAFTVMRELVGSLGLVPQATRVWSNAKGRSKRQLAERFNAMVSYRQEDWNFDRDEDGVLKDPQLRKLLPWYEVLAQAGLVARLFELNEAMKSTRDGFSHAWTSKVLKHPETLPEDGRKSVRELRSIVDAVFEMPLP